VGQRHVLPVAREGHGPAPPDLFVVRACLWSLVVEKEAGVLLGLRFLELFRSDLARGCLAQDEKVAQIPNREGIGEIQNAWLDTKILLDKVQDAAEIVPVVADKSGLRVRADDN
jgi:hypothetical protein